MVHLRLRRLPHTGPSSGGDPPLTGRAPAALPPWTWSGARRRAPRLHGRARKAAPIILVAVGSLCALLTSALALPGFVLGADRSPMQEYAKGKISEALTERPADSIQALRAVTLGRLASSTPTAAAVGVEEDETGLPSVGNVLVTLPWGSNPGEVGLASTTEGLSRGPEALAVATDGRVAVLDSVNGRLVLLEPWGQVLGTVPVPLAAPRFLAVDDDQLHVLDCDVDQRLITFDWNSLELRAVALPDLDDVVTGLFATDRGPCVEIAHETAFLVPPQGVPPLVDAIHEDLDSRAAVDGRSSEESPSQDPTTRQARPTQAEMRPLVGRPTDRGLGSLTRATFEPGQNVRIRSFNLDRDTLEPVQRGDSSLSLADGQAIEHLVSIDGDGTGGLVVGGRLLHPKVSDGQESSLVVARLTTSQTGRRDVVPNPASAARATSDSASDVLEKTDSLFLTDPTFAYLGQPYVVAPDGRIFQPWASEAGYSILIHSFAEPEEVQR